MSSCSANVHHARDPVRPEQQPQQSVRCCPLSPSSASAATPELGLGLCRGATLPLSGVHIRVRYLAFRCFRQVNFVALNSLPLSNVRNGIESKGYVLNENSPVCNPSTAVSGRGRSCLKCYESRKRHLVNLLAGFQTEPGLCKYPGAATGGVLDALKDKHAFFYSPSYPHILRGDKWALQDVRQKLLNSAPVKMLFPN